MIQPKNIFRAVRKVQKNKHIK